VKKTIIISGRPRSGTTWISEILNRITDYPIISEPLMLTKIPELIDRYHLYWRTYRNPDLEDLEFYNLIFSILSGFYVKPNFLVEARNLRTLGMFALGSPLIVKFCRANLFLPYLHKNFPQNRIILIIRNPYSVISSQILRGSWKGVKSFTPHQLEFYTDNPEFILSDPPTDPVEILAVYWCLEHAYLVKNLNRLEGVYLLKYEDMFRNPQENLPKLMDFLNIRWNDEFLKYTVIKSRSVRQGSALLAGGDPTKSYLQKLDDDQREKIRNVLQRFGNPFYSDIEDEIYSKS
jgi:hypothetical protein